MAEKSNKKRLPNRLKDIKGIVLHVEHKKISTKSNNSQIHKLSSKTICDTESKGHSMPEGRSPIDIVVDASEGFIPLWTKNTIFWILIVFLLFLKETLLF